MFEAFNRLRYEVAMVIVDHHLDLALALSDRTVILALLQNPTGLAMGADGAVYVTESGNGRVFRIVPRVTFSSITPISAASSR